MNNMLIQTINIAKTFLDGNKTIDVLKDINFAIAQGDRVAIIGPSGSGKSTFLHLLAGLDFPTSGSVLMNGTKISDLSENTKCQLRNNSFGFVYQHHHLLKDFTVLENIMMPRIINRANILDAERDALELLEMVDLQKRARMNVTKLSGGEKQRVAILRALINKPKILFADEPTGNLCQETAKSVYDSMLDLHANFNSALVVVTHDLELANKMNKIYHLRDGILTEQKI